MNQKTTRRKRSGGRSRVGEKITVQVVAPYITRNTPYLEILGEEGLVKIEEAADTLLQEIGVAFRGDEEVLKIWRDAGASVEGETVRFERGMLRQIIQATAPAEFTQHARNPDRSVRVGGKNTVFVPAYGPPFVMSQDFERRYARLEDLQNFIKLAYMSPSIHHSGGVICEPTDIPVAHRHLDTLYSHMKYSDKAFMGAVTAGSRATDCLEMVRLLFGQDFVSENCCLTSIINVNSPLVMDDTMLAALKVYARAGQAVAITPFLIAGATGPSTIAANLVQGLAETMAGAALTQLVRPGTPVLAGFLSSATNMRTGAPSRGPEPILALIGMGQLARRLGIPLRGGGSYSTSKLPDAQCGQEASTFLYSTAMAGANFVIHAAGSMEAGLCNSYEKFIMDADNAAMMQRFLQGITINDDELGLDAFREVGIGSHFLGSAHTLARYKDVFYESPIADSASFEQWTETGQKDAATRANVLWKQMLHDYEAPALNPAIDEALCAYIERRKSEIPQSFE
jgi:trimethylamine--corrinoid protein Co-methyltransferase